MFVTHVHVLTILRPGFHVEALTVGDFYCRSSFISKIFCLPEIIFSLVITDNIIDG